jgi:hypothetical protein
VLQRVQVSVVSEGEHVVLSMNSSRWRLHYEAALVFSADMRTAARVCKRFAGDVSRAYGVLGTLHDAEKPDAGQPFTPGKVYPVAREVLKSRIPVSSVGTMVVAKLGNEEATMPYRAAQRIGQWVRLRAKEAKRRAGDTSRHWGAIALRG